MPVVRQAAPFRKLNGFEAGPVMNAPLNPEVAFFVVMSSCAAEGRQAAMANRKDTAVMDSGNQRGEADIRASRVFGTLDFPLNDGRAHEWTPESPVAMSAF